MDQATQQNAAMVEQTSAAARTMMGEVEALADGASAFKTGPASSARHQAGVISMVGKHPKPIAAAKSGRSTAPASTVVAAAAMSGRTNGASAEGWRDF
jgi:methyl-accepting chemotaxis protein